MARFLNLLVLTFSVVVTNAKILAEVGADGEVQSAEDASTHVAPVADPLMNGPSPNRPYRGRVLGGYEVVDGPPPDTPVDRGTGSHMWRDVQEEDERQDSSVQEDERQDSLVRKELATLSAGAEKKSNVSATVGNPPLRRCYICGDPHMFGWDIDGTPWNIQVQFIHKYMDYWLVKSDKIWVQGRGNQRPNSASYTKGFAVGGPFINYQQAGDMNVLEAVGADHIPGQPAAIRWKYKGVWKDIYNDIMNRWKTWSDVNGEIMRAKCHGGSSCEFRFRGGRDKVGGLTATLGSPKSSCPSIDIYMKCPDPNNKVDGWCGNCNKNRVDDTAKHLYERGFYPDYDTAINERSSPPRLFMHALNIYKFSGFYMRRPNSTMMNNGKMVLTKEQSSATKCSNAMNPKEADCEKYEDINLRDKKLSLGQCVIEECVKLSQAGQPCEGLHKKADEDCKTGGAKPDGDEAEVAAYELCLYDICSTQDESLGQEVAEEVKELKNDQVLLGNR